jgi:hypothetical protein
MTDRFKCEIIVFDANCSCLLRGKGVSGFGKGKLVELYGGIEGVVELVLGSVH